MSSTSRNARGHGDLDSALTTPQQKQQQQQRVQVETASSLSDEWCSSIPHIRSKIKLTHRNKSTRDKTN